MNPPFSIRVHLVLLMKQYIIIKEGKIKYLFLLSVGIINFRESVFVHWIIVGDKVRVVVDEPAAGVHDVAPRLLVQRPEHQYRKLLNEIWCISKINQE